MAEDIQLTGGIGGHPKGLNVLFFTEMWERFSYYGMRALLTLFMIETVQNGGLGFTMEQAGEIYGSYTMWVYLSSMPGGLIADKLIGPRKAILIGGIIIALGHFTMAMPSLAAFYGGMILIVLGTGLLKPNISTMVGRLYSATDPRRDAGFSIFYMGINIGATLSPLVCGYLAQSPDFKALLVKMGLHAQSSWHFGFAAAGVGMCIGLLHLLAQYKVLDGVGERVKQQPEEPKADSEPAPSGTPGTSEKKPFFTGDEWRKLAALGILLLFNTLFWAVYEQGGSSLNVFAEKNTATTLFGWPFPSSWLQGLQPIYVIALAPVFSWLWIKLSARQPSSPAKFALGLLFLSLGILVMVPAALMSAGGKVSVLFLVSVYFVETLGELCLSPVGLSTVTKLAPRRFQSLTMAAWFVSNAIGNKVAGELSKHFESDVPTTMAYLFGGMAAATFVAAMLLFALTPKIKRLMGSVK
ncbi:MAG: peptide MFS transporter [Cyanobacteria bacterium SZAS TMP-1]|nr:peptide MFS transporter [Cyanobacteria bacterium SZAS TMP-1]